MTNVARHAAASTVKIGLAVTPTALEVEIADNGSGLAEHHVPGVGFTSMRERAAELGGTMDIRAAPRGTVCRARLPLLDTPGGDQRAD